MSDGQTGNRPGILRLTGFHRARPRYEVSQDDAHAWLAAAHARAEAVRHRGDDGFDEDDFRLRIARLMKRYGCSSESIERRASDLGDFMHTDWDRMEIFELSSNENAGGMAARMEFQSQVTDDVFRRFYSDDEPPPDDLIHVTCTGYASPSSAQKLVAERGWEHETRVTHLYHMGCYASIPAIRVAAGFVSTPVGLLTSGGRSSCRRTDIVHTELCSLHFNPNLHTPEQLVVQSLFADGYIRYSLVAGETEEPGFDVLTVREETIPGSLDDMTWTPVDWGIHMTLSKDVPGRVAEHVRSYFERLFAQAGLDLASERESTVFAIHPGGPRIVDQAREALGLRDDQVRFSRDVLRAYGNMSSATLPHVWQAIAESDDVRPGTLVASIAFGPGLTIAGALMRTSG